MRTKTKASLALLAVPLIGAAIYGYISFFDRGQRSPSRMWKRSLSSVPEKEIESRAIVALRKANTLTIRYYSHPTKLREVYKITDSSAIQDLATHFSIVPGSKAAVLLGTEEETVINIDGADELTIVGGRLYFPRPTPVGLSVKIGSAFLTRLAIQNSRNR